MDFSSILSSLTGMLGDSGIDFSELLKTLTETVKKLVEMLKPLLSSLTSGTGTTDPATPAQNA